MNQCKYEPSNIGTGDFGVSIITIATTKGGAGKTTLARLILARSALAGLKTAAIDADFNHTLTDWITTVAKHPITVRHELDETKIVPTVSELHEAHDLVVIDTAGAPSQATIFSIGCADIVLVPISPSSADIVEAHQNRKPDQERVADAAPGRDHARRPCRRAAWDEHR